MCGIIGFSGDRNCVPILLDGLGTLEYRGYDSAGVAVQTEGGIAVYKTKGRLDALRELPYFNVHFIRDGAPPLRYEISYYEGKGVLLMDSYTGYDLDSDHSEALITLPAFAQSVKRFIQDELLPHYVLSRSETIQALEYLLVMNIK